MPAAGARWMRQGDHDSSTYFKLASNDARQGFALRVVAVDCQPSNRKQHLRIDELNLQLKERLTEIPLFCRRYPVTTARIGLPGEALRHRCHVLESPEFILLESGPGQPGEQPRSAAGVERSAGPGLGYSRGLTDDHEGGLLDTGKDRSWCNWVIVLETETAGSHLLMQPLEFPPG